MPAFRYFHGSMDPLDLGTVMKGRGPEYEKSWGGTDFYRILETSRPEHGLAHACAVFAVGHPDDIDLAGGGTEWVFELEPLGPVSRHDINWSSEISMLLSDGHAAESLEIAQAAKNYWAGMPHSSGPVWECLMPAARIIQSGPYDGFELDLPRADGPASSGEAESCDVIPVIQAFGGGHENSAAFRLPVDRLAELLSGSLAPMANKPRGSP